MQPQLDKCFGKTVPNLRAWLQHVNLLLTLVVTSERKVDWYTGVFPKFILFFLIHLAFEMCEEFGPI